MSDNSKLMDATYNVYTAAHEAHGLDRSKTLVRLVRKDNSTADYILIDGWEGTGWAMNHAAVRAMVERFLSQEPKAWYGFAFCAARES